MLVWACIAPHGGELIPELANGTHARMATTRAAMEELGRRAREASPDTFIVYTPHGLYVEGYACVSVTHKTAGVLDGDHGSRVSASFDVDRELAEALVDRATDLGVPSVEAAFQPNGEPSPVLPLDWGALVPLWFMGARWQPTPGVVTICPSRALSRRQLLELGRATAEAAEASERRVAIICSADQGHGHHASGPYGFAAESASYDRAYCRAVRDDALKRLLRWRSSWIEAALPDSYWQTLMLLGAMERVPMRGELLSYEAPTYFGMACAEYRRI